MLTADDRGEEAAVLVPQMSAPNPARDAWESRYRSESYVYGTDPNEYLAASLAHLGTGDALCLAEGEGRNAAFLAAAGFRVTSVDWSEAGVEKTRRLAAARGVEVDAVVGDLATYDLGSERFDLIVSIFAHVPPPVRRDLHRRVVTALRPGGVLLLEAYTPAQIGYGTGGPPNAELTMTLEALREELAPLEFAHGAELERGVHEGDGHTGPGAVVQVLARRPR